MRLSRIFVKQPLKEGARLELEPKASHYLKNVLRLKPGAVVSLFNGKDSCDYQAILDYQGKRAIVEVQTAVAAMTESSLSTEIIQGLSRSDHLDLMIQKTTELGVNRLSIFNAQHSQIPVKPSQKVKKLNHWQAIANKACEQSGRHHPPEIQFFSSLAELLQQPQQRDVNLLLHFQGEKIGGSTIRHLDGESISLIVGPEGGLCESEEELAVTNGFQPTSLGPRVLRTETAAITGLAIIQSIWGDI